MKFLLQGKRKWYWVILGGLVLIVIYQYRSQIWMNLLHLYDISHNRYRLKAYIRSFGPYSPLAYVLLQILQVIVAPIPGGAIEFLGGYLFGVWGGFLYSMVGLIIGSWIAFSLARAFEKLALEKFVSEKTIKKFDYLIGHEGAILSFLLFVIPGFPKDALCYLLGLTPMHIGVFLVISTIGRIPGTLMAVLQGGKAFECQYVTFFVLLVLSGLIILAFYIYHDEIHRWIKGIRRVKS